MEDPNPQPPFSSTPLLPIAYSPKQISNLLSSIRLLNDKKGRVQFENKVLPIKIELEREPINAMAALTQLTSFPELSQGDEIASYLEKRSKNEEEDFFLIRTRFASKAREVFPEMNSLTSLTLGEAFAKKVRYAATYAPEIEAVLDQVISHIRNSSS